MGEGPSSRLFPLGKRSITVVAVNAISATIFATSQSISSLGRWKVRIEHRKNQGLIREILSNAWIVYQCLDPNRFEFFAIPYSRIHEDLWRSYYSSRYDDFFSSLDLSPCTLRLAGIGELDNSKIVSISCPPQASGRRPGLQ